MGGKYTREQQIPILYVEEVKYLESGREVLLQGEIYIPEEIYTEKMGDVEETLGGRELTIEVEGEEHTIELRYKRAKVEELVCTEEEEESSLEVKDIAEKLLTYVRERVEEAGVEEAEIMDALLVLAYDLEHMRYRYRCREVELVLEEDVEVQGLVFKRGTIIQGQSPGPKSICQCLL